MTPDEYVLSVLARYRVAAGPSSAAAQAGQALYPVIAAWAGGYLLEARYSGSYAKGTGVRGGNDVDIFISLAPGTPVTLNDIYWNLVSFLSARGWAPRPQNVSVGITCNGAKVDLVPARKQAGNTSDHSLYRRKADTWTQTNVGQHIALVANSGRLAEIRAIKLWRQLHGLDFPSFYLELTVIEALRGRWTNQPSANVISALRYIADKLPTARVLDPANTNNAVSDDLTLAEKQAIARQAAQSAAHPWWEGIIW